MPGPSIKHHLLPAKGVTLPRSARFKFYCIRSNNSCNSEKISLSSIKNSEKCQKWEQKALALPERSKKLYQKVVLQKFLVDCAYWNLKRMVLLPVSGRFSWLEFMPVSKISAINGVWI
ncbi:hypothetical protein OIU76_025135 [Salix suchowensis]|nr:hypothetical protein OIU76_025135 [Salix suchowensis]